MKLELNESALDRVVRIGLGVFLVALGGLGVVAAPLVYVVWVVAAVVLLTGIVGFCPLYAVFRFSTRAR
jgi:hypothetical protein